MSDDHTPPAAPFDPTSPEAIKAYLEGFLNPEGSPNVFSVTIDESEEPDTNPAILLVGDARNTCFHLAVTMDDQDSGVEMAKEICSQAVLYRTSDRHPEMYFAVYSRATQMVHFCACDPKQKWYQDLYKFSKETEPHKVQELLEWYIQSSAAVLLGRQPVTMLGRIFVA